MSENSDIVEFAPFRFDARRRQLARNGQPVPLSSRAVDILALLLEHRDRVLTKDEIITRVWRGVAVEENNLAVQVSSLRRALNDTEAGAPLIVTVPGQGYRFVGRVAPPAEAAAAIVPAAAPAIPDPTAEIPPAPARPGRNWRAAALAAAVIAAAAGAIVAISLYPRSAPLASPRLSIAVLPFRDLSDDRCCAYLADAVSDDLTTDLSHMPGSVVIARESSDMYRDKSVPTADIGHSLNVRYLLEGSLRSVDDIFSVNAQLIEAATGRHLWAEHFNVPRNHLAEAQNAVVHRLASALGVTLFQIEGSATSRQRGSDPDALDLFFQARSMLDRSDSLESMQQARHLLEQALQKQSEFADALGELAWLLPRMANVDEVGADAEISEARRIVAQAEKIAPDAGLTLAARGALLSWDENCEQARSKYAAALDAEPDNVRARTGLSVCLAKLGQFADAEVQLQELLRIDPAVGTANRYRFYWLGFANVMMGRPPEALDWLARAEAGDPEPSPTANNGRRMEEIRLFRIAALEMTGQPEKARALYTAFENVWPYRSAWRWGAYFSAAQAHLAAFGRTLDALVAAGMPRTISESADYHVPAMARLENHDLYAPTPTQIPGAEVITTAALQLLVNGNAAPSIVNIGADIVTLPETIPCSIDLLSGAGATQCGSAINAAGRRPVVVMGLNAMDWNGYNAALALVAAGVTPVLWYRGGAEAWAALPHAPMQDKRPE